MGGEGITIRIVRTAPLTIRQTGEITFKYFMKSDKFEKNYWRNQILDVIE